jgi:hypothetical protein
MKKTKNTAKYMQVYVRYEIMSILTETIVRCLFNFFLKQGCIFLRMFYEYNLT